MMEINYYGGGGDFFEKAFFANDILDFEIENTYLDQQITTYQPDTGWYATANGTGFAFAANNTPTGGTINDIGFNDESVGLLEASFDKIDWSLPVFYNSLVAIDESDDYNLLSGLFSSQDINIDGRWASEGFDMPSEFYAELDITSRVSANGTSYDDRLFGGNANDSLSGGSGDDELFGLRGNDTIFGGGNNDLIRGGLQNDRLFGETGDDRLFGDAGFDRLSGGDGNDRLAGGGQADNLFGGNDDDTLLGEGGRDRLFGGNGLDRLFGGTGNDGLFGQAQDDELNGGSGNDVLWGGSGRDLLSGGIGDDILRGGAGFDTLIGSVGDDTLTGNFNADRFVFSDFGGGFGNDVITDFDAFSNAEKIDITGVSAVANLTDLFNNHLSQVGADTVFDDLSGNTVTLLNVQKSDLGAGDFLI